MEKKDTSIPWDEQKKLNNWFYSHTVTPFLDLINFITLSFRGCREFSISNDLKVLYEGCIHFHAPLHCNHAVKPSPAAFRALWTDMKAGNTWLLQQNTCRICSGNNAYHTVDISNLCNWSLAKLAGNLMTLFCAIIIFFCHSGWAGANFKPCWASINTVFCLGNELTETSGCNHKLFSPVLLFGHGATDVMAANVYVSTWLKD